MNFSFDCKAQWCRTPFGKTNSGQMAGGWLIRSVKGVIRVCLLRTPTDKLHLGHWDLSKGTRSLPLLTGFGGIIATVTVWFWLATIWAP